jgi:inhibitor of cysteine peptidase
MATGEALSIGGRHQPKLILWIVGIISATLVGIALFGAAVYLVADDEEMPVVLTSDDSGTTYRMQLDEEIVVALDGNATTGYQWAIDELDETVVRSLGSTYIAPSNGAVGQGGVEEWSFRALEPGTTVLSLKYWRQWEGDASVVERFDIILTVED